MISILTIKQQIKDYIGENKISLGAFARKCDLKEPTLWRFMAGQNVLRIDNLNKILKVLNDKM